MKRIIIISIILIILIFFVFRFFVLNDELNDEVIETSNLKDYNIEDYIDISYFADISSYYVYGTHFNIEGTLNNVHDIFNEYVIFKLFPSSSCNEVPPNRYSFPL